MFFAEASFTPQSDNFFEKALMMFLNWLFTVADTPRGEPPFHRRRNMDEMIAMAQVIQGRRADLSNGEQRISGLTPDYVKAMALAEAMFIDDAETDRNMGHFPATDVVCRESRRCDCCPKP